MAKKRPQKRSRVLRLLPVTITMLSLLLVIKANEMYFESRKLRELYAVRDAVASEKKEEAGHDDKKAEEKKSDEKKADEKGHDEKPAAEGDKKDADKKEGEAVKEGDAKKDDEKKDEAKKEEGGHDKEGSEGEHGKEAKPPEEPKTFGTGKSTVKEIEAQKAKNSQELYSKSELDLLQNLSKRRDELDNRERDLELKSKVLEATEKRISDRMVEMKTLEGEMQRVLAQYNQKQDDQLKSLVKIYENMKPDEAANIFNEMEMPILLEVIGRMSERKVAPVLANMSPKKARDVTQELAEKRKRAASMAAAAAAAAPAATPAAAPAPAPAAKP